MPAAQLISSTQSQRLSCGSSMPGKKSIGAKKTLENVNDKAEPDDKDDFTSLAEDLDRGEQEAANDEDEDISKNIAADLEEAMKE